MILHLSIFVFIYFRYTKEVVLIQNLNMTPKQTGEGNYCLVFLFYLCDDMLISLWYMYCWNAVCLYFKNDIMLLPYAQWWYINLNFFYIKTVFAKWHSMILWAVRDIFDFILQREEEWFSDIKEESIRKDNKQKTCWRRIQQVCIMS